MKENPDGTLRPGAAERLAGCLTRIAVAAAAIFGVCVLIVVLLLLLG